MIPIAEKEGWHYLELKMDMRYCMELKTLKHKSEPYCLNCFQSFRTEEKLKSYEKVCKNIDFHGIIMSSQNDNILLFNQYMKSGKMPYIIYTDLKFLIKK